MTFDEFFAACDKLKAAGIPALGVGDSGIWASAELFENTLLGVFGPKGWNSRQVGIHPTSTDKSLSNLAWRDLLSI
jgi:ABC-type glycerol-3-phosphate transport system substrate-binding protein